MLYPFFLAVIAIIICLILTLRISTKFECIKERDSSDILILFYIFSGIIKRKFIIPSTDILQILKKAHALLLSEKGILSASDKQYPDSDDLKQRYGNINKLTIYYNYLKLFIASIQKDLSRRRIPHVKLNIKAIYGTNNAFWTGIIGGVIYSIIGSIDSLLTSKFKVIEKNILVEPDFTKNIFEIEALCILNIRLVHIIKAGFFLLIDLINEKVKNIVRR